MFYLRLTLRAVLTPQFLWNTLQTIGERATLLLTSYSLTSHRCGVPGRSYPLRAVRPIQQQAMRYSTVPIVAPLAGSLILVIVVLTDFFIC